MILAEEAATLDASVTDAIGAFNDDIFWAWVLIPLLASLFHGGLLIEGCP